MGFLSDMRDRWRRIEVFTKDSSREGTACSGESLLESILRWRRGAGAAIIAEYKRASPSGIIDMELDIRDYYYQLADLVAGFSVVVEREWFMGSERYIEILRMLGWRGPIIAKGFVFYREQVCRYREAGASAILLIADILDRDELLDLYKYSEEKDLDPLVEIGGNIDPGRIIGIVSPKIIGVNSRNLETLEIQPERMLKTIRSIKREYPDIVVVAESGMRSLDDIARAIEAGADACLIGTELMRNPRRASMLSELYGVLGVEKRYNLESLAPSGGEEVRSP